MNTVVNWRDRIVIDPAIMVGKPVIKGTRITVELILRKLAAGLTMETILADYPQLSTDDIRAALAFASDAIGSEEIVGAERAQ